MQEIRITADQFSDVIREFVEYKKRLKAEHQAATDPLNLMRFFPFSDFFREWRVRLAEYLRELADLIEEGRRW